MIYNIVFASDKNSNRYDSLDYHAIKKLKFLPAAKKVEGSRRDKLILLKK